MTFRDADNDDVCPEYMAGYVAYGNNQTENPYPLAEVADTDWSEAAIKQRRINARYNRWERGYRDAKFDSDWALR
jgi:hypothetical protein